MRKSTYYLNESVKFRSTSNKKNAMKDNNHDFIKCHFSNLVQEMSLREDRKEREE